MKLYNCVQTNIYWQVKKGILKNTEEHWKYRYGYDQSFTNESNFGINWPIRSLYSVKQINQKKKKKNYSSFLIFSDFYPPICAYLSICLSIYLSLPFLSLYFPFFFPSIHFTIYLSIYLFSLTPYLSIYLSIYLFSPPPYLSIYLSLFSHSLSIYLSISFLSLPIYLSIYLSIYHFRLFSSNFPSSFLSFLPSILQKQIITVKYTVYASLLSLPPFLPPLSLPPFLPPSLSLIVAFFFIVTSSVFFLLSLFLTSKTKCFPI